MDKSIDTKSGVYIILLCVPREVSVCVCVSECFKCLSICICRHLRLRFRRVQGNLTVTGADEESISE